MNLRNKNILIIISGGIAAYKVCELIRLLKKREANIKVIMTKNATNFITPLTIQTLSQNRVYIDSFEYSNYDIEHISLSDWADLVIVAPATANIIGKFANGIADDLATTTLLATKKPIIIVPSMNTNMYENKSVQRNIETLKNENGVIVVEPESGFLACGVYGKGRYPDNSFIVFEAEKALTKKDLYGIKILITTGPTREFIDPVRFISNRSSGKMGIFLAEEAVKRGAKVLLISGPSRIEPLGNINKIDVTTADEMFEQVKENFKDYDICIFAAAVSDYKPKKMVNKKIKKENENKLLIEFIKNPDILEYVGKNKNENQIVVGFAAETNDVINNARDKLLRKNADIIVANDVTKEGAGFDVDTNIVTIVDKERHIECPLLTKREVANAIYDYIINCLCKN
ncbi:bifunctional phosphopantothenoylcysteine decarboxylase/phosphopantothenate--cysteine ligase CoaBC [Caldicellulosiruptoraceae bacterium PP1]